jgi:GNAT superfamily N-acetyltransferase
MLPVEFKLHRITSLDDPWLLPWLELYETAFLPHERVLVAGLLMQIKEKSQGIDDPAFFSAWIGADDEFKGMAYYEMDQEIGLLWYLAIDPRWRSLGLGADFYRALLKDVQKQAGRMLLFEVEIPAEIQEPEQRLLADRRIRFYRRQGAFLLDGISYMQYVGSHQPLMPMHLMVHPLSPLTPQQAFDFARLVFGDNLQQTGELKFI